MYAEGDSWLLYKRNEREAVIENHPIDFMSELIGNGIKCSVLKFWRKRSRPGSSHSGACQVTSDA